MNKTFLLFALLSIIATLVGVTPLSAQTLDLTRQGSVERKTVASLPSAVTYPGAIAVVTDSAGSTCVSGGGSVTLLCQSNGVAWVVIGGGGGSGLSGIAVDQIPVGSGPSTTIFLPASQGALAYNDSSPGPQNFHQASVTELSDGTSGTGTICLTTGCTMVNPTLGNFAATTGTYSGTGPSQTSYQFQSTCTTPGSGIEYICAPVNGYLQISQNGQAYETPAMHLLSTSYTNATLSPSTISGLQSPTIGKGQNVIFHCVGLYKFATTAEEMAVQVTTSQTPQSIWYDAQFVTNGSFNTQSSTSANNLLTAAAVGSTSASLIWRVDGEIFWNASTAGTFSIQAATSSVSGTLSVTPGAQCEVDLVN